MLNFTVINVSPKVLYYNNMLNVNIIERNFDHIAISTNDYKISDPKPIFPRID